MLFDQDGEGNHFLAEKLPLFQKAAFSEKVRVDICVLCLYLLPVVAVARQLVHSYITVSRSSTSSPLH